MKSRGVLRIKQDPSYKNPEGGWKEGGREREAFWVIAIVKPRRSVTTTNPPTHKMKIVVQSKY
jgi:hypothetical protein